MSIIYDAIIVGAGPAGATAAYFLGQAGRRVLVLEKEVLPPYKACGGAVSTHVLEQFPFSFEPVIESKVNSISYALGEQVVRVPLVDQSIRMVMRREFDAFLLDHAEAEIRPGTALRAVEEQSDRVIVETADGRCLESRFLIGADGANSVTARSGGLRTGKVLAGALEVEAVVPADILARFAEKPLLYSGRSQLVTCGSFQSRIICLLGLVRSIRGQVSCKLR